MAQQIRRGTAAAVAFSPDSYMVGIATTPASLYTKCKQWLDGVILGKEKKYAKCRDNGDTTIRKNIENIHFMQQNLQFCIRKTAQSHKMQKVLSGIRKNMYGTVITLKC